VLSFLVCGNNAVLSMEPYILISFQNEGLYQAANARYVYPKSKIKLLEWSMLREPSTCKQQAEEGEGAVQTDLR